MAKVKVYSTPTCPWCTKVKDYLKEKKIEFEELDVSTDDKARNYMVEKSGQIGVPVTEIGDDMIIGYDTDALDKALGI